MCGVAEAIAGASLVMGVVQGQQQMSAANRAAADQNEAANANAIRANAAAVNDYNAIQKRLVQEGESRVEARIEQDRAGREAIGTATAATSQAGMAGLSVNALLADYARVTSGNKAKIDRQSEMNTAQIESEKQSVKANAENRIASVPQARGVGMNWAGLGASALGAFETYDRMDSRRPAGQRKAPWNK